MAEEQAQQQVQQPPAEKPADQPEPRPDVVWGTGRRKTSVARVRIFKGAGKITVNKLDVNDFFTDEQDRLDVRAPLRVTKALNNYDVVARVNGGGHAGQAVAFRMGLARALRKADQGLEPALKESGFLTRDDRRKERKKYGRRGARRGCQFSKR